MGTYTALTIAGSDSGGGAGIQADLKTFQELGVFGTTAITALTAQNTLGVHGVYPQSLQIIEDQIDVVLSDIGANAVKTGMLFSSDIIRLVARKLKHYEVSNIVVDPVMIAKGGAELLQMEAVEALKEALIPLATVITPNIPEAEKLLGIDKIESLTDMEQAAKQLHEFGPEVVVIKGGHLVEKAAIDIIYDGHQFEYLETKRIQSKHTHGTGCTFASAIAAELAKGNTIFQSIKIAKAFIQTAIEDGIRIGKGISPTNHAAFRKNIKHVQ